MADPIPGATVAGITEEAKAILAEVHADAVKVGSEVKGLALDVSTLVMSTGQAAGAAFSNVLQAVWDAARAKFGKAALLLAVLLCCAGSAQAQCKCSGPGNCDCVPGYCTCPNCVVHPAAAPMTAKCEGCTCVPGYLPCPACERVAARKAMDGKQIVYQGHRWTWSFAADDWIDAEPAPVIQPVSLPVYQPVVMRQAFSGGGAVCTSCR